MDMRQSPACLTPDQVHRLFAVIESPRDRAIFRLAYHAGLRVSEVGLLQLSDYDPRRERIYVTRLKGSPSGMHYLVREESKALKVWLKVRGQKPGPLFPSRQKRGISRICLGRLIAVYGATARLPRNLRHFHCLKHSCARHLFQQGLPAEVVQDWMGHGAAKSTMVYTPEKSTRTKNARRKKTARFLRHLWR